MGLDWETHRIVTSKGHLRALVYTIGPNWIIMRRRLDVAATKDKTFRSMASLKAYVRQRRWRLEKARPCA
jgi:hypothetical protein